MKRIKIVLTIIFVLFATVIAFGYIHRNNIAYAATECPSTMDPNSQACVDYLYNELAKLQKESKNIRNELKEEEYQQLSLSEKISYMQKQIADTEKVIKSLEVDIAAHDVEIKLLEKSILEKEDNISLLRQEADVLEKTVSKRVSESYKYSFVGPFEVFMDVTNLSTVLRKTKYLAVTRTQDREAIESFASTMSQLKDEEIILAKEKSDLQLKRNSMEENKVELAGERTKLNSQKAEQDSLLAQSKRREADYRAQLSAINRSMGALDDKISDIVVKLYAQGMLKNGTKVSAGQYIGFQGHTGCSYGSHLHFDIRNRYDVRQNPSNYLSGGIEYQMIKSKVYISPLQDAILTQRYYTYHRAWDMRSTSQGNQDWSKTYTVPKGICTDADRLISQYGPTAYLMGEGAPVKAIAKGTVYYGTIIPNGVNGSKYPAKYALLIHEDGNKSFYLHLK